ncbi:zinc-binding dehydrogenase [Brachybacterium sp. J153]|uniref:zinc-binding dehydrogenase n=1 Tax=Brachybacterium sp. J153 TaxID=3116488 RepID=UPI002E77152E|nr:zinc-binding dehydrogenase [Brachybacterium sp. J153]MEE1619438.1 zinc-binding dehydrogenase [Brachybacterium sp. J153]
MLTVTYDRFGEPADVLRTAAVDSPTPGAGEVLLRMLLSPIHHHDLWTIRGTYGVRPALPSGAGSEGVAVVEALGEGVEGLAVGDRVAASAIPGAWAELVTARASSLIPLPAELPDESAAQLVAMPFSAVSLLEHLDLAPGEVLVQNAATGAVGRLVAQFARIRGIRVISLVRRGSGVEELAAQGIGDVIATDREDWQEQARSLIGEAHVAAGLDSVGGEASAQVLSLLGDGGRLVVFGAMGGSTMALPSGPIIFRNLRVEGFWGSRVSQEMSPEVRRRLLGEILSGLLSGEVTLPVAATFALDEVTAAVAATLTDGRQGKVLLRP